MSAQARSSEEKLCVASETLPEFGLNDRRVTRSCPLETSPCARAFNMENFASNSDSVMPEFSQICTAHTKRYSAASNCGKRSSKTNIDLPYSDRVTRSSKLGKYPNAAADETGIDTGSDVMFHDVPELEG
ncbi:aldo-keto reductase family 4 member C9-like protein, putative [Babesia ovata]|uniref:Aldo-keto reductase family 4 member C9-like protein, putative n=1 Tax=Babesia ovata TaxID=189622 RepID=A0A2H6K704_9APIC|nr:aldo-keto reductase family 4 member C9-like protein, putative [Babesia ovata]GBE58759.1 aldo-keto reductase family 4 member C9-like protein, putative [Babesia ovata]